MSHALVEEWPHPSVGDLLAWRRLDFPSVTLGEGDAQRMLDFTGGHAGMVRHCLERWEMEGGDAQLQEWCCVCPELWETWHRLARDVDRDRLRAMIGRDSLGPAVPWPTDVVTRALYWEDLLVAKGPLLAWRAEIVRQVGREIVA